MSSSSQLTRWKEENGHSHTRLTTSHGAPVGDKMNSMTAGEKGPIVLQDHVMLDELAHFGRERIPERVVHAKGAGAFGYFEVTHDITKYCKARIFESIGKRTDLAVRFSTVGGESGSADTVRDPRGFAVKFYTEDGNWDLVGNNTPIFFIRDPIFFPSFIHTQKRNPETHLKDPDMFWDFISLRPETCHQVSFLFSDRGIPDGYRFMNGYGSHTFKLVNKNDEAVYCKFHYKSNQGIKNLSVEKAEELSASDPDYSIRDLYDAIARGDFPSWTMYIQVMTYEQAENWYWNPFDLTKVWPHAEFPLIPVGKIVLNRNHTNYFAEIEQLAFAPAHMVPGIEPSPDKMLQGRLYSYIDTHRHRLGNNYLQLPVNCAKNATVSNYQRDSNMCFINPGGAPNYYPNSFGGPTGDPAKYHWHANQLESVGQVKRYRSDDEDNYTQVGMFYEKVLTVEEKERLARNIAEHLSGAKDFLQERVCINFGRCYHDYGQKIRKHLERIKSEKTRQNIPGKL